MRYDDQIVDQVQSASDIVDIIGQVVPLKKAGRNFKGLCPFHGEKTPSFMVSPEKQIYHCFGCGAGGNVFGFLMQHENLSFPEALRQLAERAHITLPERASEARRDRTETEKIFEAYRLAADYYHGLFLGPQGKAARDYFSGRGFPAGLIEEFQVGWAPDAWQGLYTFLSKKGVQEEIQLKARLVTKSEKGRVYDVFRGRLLFPIRNLQGKVVAFGGRIIVKSDGPKYLNSPEHPAFVKRRELFGLDFAKKHLDRELPRIFVVEGYLDFLRLYSCGFKNAVATLGTSLTEEHVQVLKRFVQEAVVVYDGDRAGEAASLRGLEVFLEGGLGVKLIRMPEGSDPDDFLRKEGTGAFAELARQASDFFDYKLEALLKKYDPRDSLGLMKITNDCLETLVKVQNPFLLDRYFRKLSGALGIDESSLRQEHQKMKQKASGRAEKKEDAPKAGIETLKAGGAADEVLLLGLLIDDSSLAALAFAELEETDFEGKFARPLFQSLKRMRLENQPWNWPRILNRLEHDDFKRQLVSVTSLGLEPADKEKAFKDCLKSVKKKRLLRRLDEIRREIARAENQGNQALVLDYTRQYQSLLQQMR